MTDNRMIIATVVGTGIAMTTVIVTFVGIIAGGINDRSDDVNTNVNNRIGDLNDSVNNRFNDVNSRIDDLNRRIDDLQNDMRELRTLVIDALKSSEPPTD